MSVRANHVPIDRLTALAFVARAPEDDQDQQLLAHIADCDRCATELARLTMDADQLRDVAFAEADAVFDESMLDSQRSRILDRLANIGQVARVLRFPRRSRDVTMPVTTGSRRWISIAAAAGLIIGLLGGQLLHLVPWEANARRDTTATRQAPARPNGNAAIPAPAGITPVSDEELLNEIEAAVQLRPVRSLRALDALTLTANDPRDRLFGQ